MSLRFGSVGLFCSLVAISIAARQATDDAPTNSRGPAAVEPAALRIVPTIKHTEKLRGPLSVTVYVIGTKPTKAGDVFVLRGTIASRKTLEQTSFTWSLPKSVELVNGATTGILTSINEQQPATIEITLRKLSDDNAQVHLMAQSTRGEIRFGDVAQYNTNFEDMLEHKNAVLGGAKALPESASELKVFH